MFSISFVFILIIEIFIVSYASKSSTHKNDSILIEEIASILKSKYTERQEFCSKQKWWDEYKENHAKILKSKDPRLLVFVPHLSGKATDLLFSVCIVTAFFIGLADRIIGLTTLCLFAMVTNRAFQIGKRSALPNFETVFDLPNINWLREPEDPEWLVEPLTWFAHADRHYNQSIVNANTYFGINGLENFPLLDRLVKDDLNAILREESQIVLMSNIKGLTLRFMEQNSHYKEKLTTEYKIKREYLFPCLVDYLFQPKPFLFTYMPNEFLALTKTFQDEKILPIAIQIRSGDRYLFEFDPQLDLQNYVSYFSCAEQIEHWALKDANSNYKSAKWLLVTDSLAIRKAAMAKYGSDKIITNIQNPIEHSSKEELVCRKKGCVVSDAGFHTAAAEWWLMSYARYHVITRSSGFGRSAAMHSLHYDSIFTMEIKHRGSVNCRKGSASNLHKLGTDWSGI